MQIFFAHILNTNVRSPTVRRKVMEFNDNSFRRLFSLQMVKAGLVLGLFGGCQRHEDDKVSYTRLSENSNYWTTLYTNNLRNWL